MRIFDLRRAAVAVALLAVVAVLAGCCCGRPGRRVPRVRVTRVQETTTQRTQQRASRSLMMTRAPGVTDDIVEVYRDGPVGLELVAAYLLQRPTSSSPSMEHWIIQNGETWPLMLGPDTWIQTATTQGTLDDLCMSYAPMLGWGAQAAPIYEVTYSGPMESSSSCPDQAPW